MNFYKIEYNYTNQGCSSTGYATLMASSKSEAQNDFEPDHWCESVEIVSVNQI